MVHTKFHLDRLNNSWDTALLDSRAEKGTKRKTLKRIVFLGQKRPLKNLKRNAFFNNGSFGSFYYGATSFQYDWFYGTVLFTVPPTHFFVFQYIWFWSRFFFIASFGVFFRFLQSGPFYSLILRGKPENAVLPWTSLLRCFWWSLVVFSNDSFGGFSSILICLKRNFEIETLFMVFIKSSNVLGKSLNFPRS